MSQILVGYVRIKNGMSKEQCAIEMLQTAAKVGLGLWLDDQVHSELMLNEVRKSKDCLVFSFSDTLQYETINKLLLSDLCRDEPNLSSLEEDLENIITVLKVADYFSDLLHLFLGVYQSFLHEYGECKEISLDNLKKELESAINNNLFPFRWYSIISSPQNKTQF